MKNKNQIFLLFVMLMVIGMMTGYFINIAKQYALPFFSNTFSDALYYFIILIAFILALLITDHFFLTRHSSAPKFHQQQNNQRIMRFVNLGIAFITFSGLFYLFYLANHHAIQGVYFKTNELMGKPVIKEFGVKFEPTKNPTYKQKINIGTAQRVHYIMDSSAYLIHITLYDNQREYPLDAYCSIDEMPPKLKQPIIRIRGFHSFLGFHCEKSQCNLSDFFENASQDVLYPEQFANCDVIQKHMPEVL
ncbi:hypothetical protein [Acinetobacter shaoyimingii]|uniref:Uncharacterized protein n=1 Tax=Acinetobacter shaoyimingii TaxID=2715164 RepID=A0A6G8RYV1_9GAMM|nr:hypothetical protein [Acinetobacter shaoyimingii]QIO07077.1 hypothetical protein G8E00_14595 [Acinetobacter shaoyimingii]